MVTTIDELTGSVTKHVSHAAEKVRRQRSVAAVVNVFMHQMRRRSRSAGLMSISACLIRALLQDRCGQVLFDGQIIC